MHAPRPSRSTARSTFHSLSFEDFHEAHEAIDHRPVARRSSRGASFARAVHAPAAATSDAAASTTVASAGSTQPGTPQRTKMKTCNADAKVKDVHGADRKAFMKQCLSGKSKPADAS